MRAHYRELGNNSNIENENNHLPALTRGFVMCIFCVGGFGAVVMFARLISFRLCLGHVPRRSCFCVAGPKGLHASGWRGDLRGCAQAASQRGVSVI